MLFELGHMRDGGLVLMSNSHFPAEVKRVEYYIAQRLFKLVFEAPDQSEHLVPYEISDFAADLVKKAPGNILVVDAENPDNLEGFDVPLVQVGV